MAEDLAREIIAQSRGGSKLALSFDQGEALLYISKDSKKNTVYHVHERRDLYIEQYEYAYADAESAASLVLAFIPRSSMVTVQLVLYNDGVDCTEVAYLGKHSGSSLTELIQDKIKLLNVINVATL